ncbi:MAG TPA: hypothetical protein VFE71_01715 [Bacteroidales bacterium]|nr:hypothetical protein [Bacteroidales bacterium]
MTSLTEFTSFLKRETKWHGDHNENGNRIILNSGQLSMFYECGNLRYICFGNNEIIRMIYSAVRDKDWLTISPIISEEEFELKTDSFIIKYNAHYLSGEINFLAHYSITGNSDNSVIFSFEGEALEDFEKNRIGICLLHPIEGNKGEKCKIVHSNDEEENMLFPFFISPNQPFHDIKSMRWERAGITSTIDFFGDVFETEDQRNWTDASYKTYCTPLERTFPVKIHSGERISQKVVLKVETEELPQSNDSQQISISFNKRKIFSFPLIGVGQSTRHQSLRSGEIEILKKIKFDHYRVDLYLFDKDWRNKGDIAFEESIYLEYNLELAIFFDGDYNNQISQFLQWINTKKVEPIVILLFQKNGLPVTSPCLNEIGPLLKRGIPHVMIGLGTNANFAQLNRNRPQPESGDNICYSIHPQEHASDNSSLAENLHSQRDTAESAMEFANNRKIWISPVNIQRRFNANIANYEKQNDVPEFPPQVDSRLMSLFGACWTIGSLKYLFYSGIKGVTFFETVGERGIIQGDFNSRWPDDFRSCKGMIFPVYFVLKYILENKNFVTLECISTHPLEIDSLVITDGRHLKIILVNFTPEIQNVSINDCSGEFSLRKINQDNYTYAVSDAGWLEKSSTITVKFSEPLFVEPFSITFLEG